MFLTFIFAATTAGSAVSLNLATPSLLLATTFLLGANPITVSLVQVAVSLPLFLFTLPSGALADVIDSQRLLISVEVAILAVSVVFAGLHQHRYRRPHAGEVRAPPTETLRHGRGCRSPISWPRRVSRHSDDLALETSDRRRQDLDSATAANGVAFNIGRAAGAGGGDY